MPRLELKSWRTFLASKHCQRTKIQKVIKLARSSNKKWLQIRAIAVKLLKDGVLPEMQMCHPQDPQNCDYYLVVI